ncbi:MAG: ATPase domain-containing protein [Bryobacteraceae bacterium]
MDPIPTGFPALDAALGTGGYPRGRMVEIFGPDGCGKTALALGAVAEVQRRGGTAAFIDADHALSAEAAARRGVDAALLAVARPESGEQALAIASALAASGSVDLIVVDSVAALVPRLELEAGIGDLSRLQARLLAEGLRRLAPRAARSGACLLFVNQLRERKVTVGDPETTAGGSALKLHAAVRLELRAVRAAGTLRVRARVVKNSLAPAFRAAELEIV